MAIRLATGSVLWSHDYDSPNGGPDGVTVADGIVYAATNSADPSHRTTSTTSPRTQRPASTNTPMAYTTTSTRRSVALTG
jgi:hypothetical protein